MLISRRNVIVGLGSGLILGPALRAFSSTDVAMGDMTISSVSDGHLVLPAGFFFEGLPQDELRDILARHGITGDQLEPACNVTVLRQGARVVLFDAGSGSSFMPTAGRLIESLGAIGIVPEDVTDVVLTHAHPDHIWGVLDDFDDLVFADATYHISDAEWAYWSDPATVDSIGEARASFAVGAQRRLEAIEPQVAFFKPDGEILPGITAVATFGHTPGHTSFHVSSGPEALMIVGDAIGNHHVAFARPEWHSGADHDPETGARTRTALLDRLATDAIPMIGFHLPDGGFGRVERAEAGFNFMPGAN